MLVNCYELRRGVCEACSGLNFVRVCVGLVASLRLVVSLTCGKLVCREKWRLFLSKIRHC